MIYCNLFTDENYKPILDDVGGTLQVRGDEQELTIEIAQLLLTYSANISETGCQGDLDKLNETSFLNGLITVLDTVQMMMEDEDFINKVLKNEQSTMMKFVKLSKEDLEGEKE